MKVNLLCFDVRLDAENIGFRNSRYSCNFFKGISVCEHCFGYFTSFAICAFLASFRTSFLASFRKPLGSSFSNSFRHTLRLGAGFQIGKVVQFFFCHDHEYTGISLERQ